jgi:hypothetical protein
MKKILTLIILGITVLSCNPPETLNESFQGNWVRKDFFEKLKKHKDPTQLKGIPCEELIFMPTDTAGFSYLNLGIDRHHYKGTIISGKRLEVSQFNRDYMTSFEISSNGKTLTYQTTHPERKVEFVRASELSTNLDVFITPYASIQLINEYLFAGNYKNILNDSSVVISTLGTIQGLGDRVNYSICISGDCQKFSEKPVVFLSNEKHTGFYYEWELKGDTLNIYSIDFSKYPNQKEFKRLGIFCSLVKTN